MMEQELEGAEVAETPEEVQETNETSEGDGTQLQSSSETISAPKSDAQATAGASAGVTADEVRQIVEEVVGAKVNESEGRITKSVQDGDAALMALGQDSGESEVVTLEASKAFSYVPQDSPQYVAQYLTPFLWGIAAGFVAFLIGYLWEAFARLIGLAGRK